jgi:ABC-type sugar transport system permease subunit
VYTNLRGFVLAFQRIDFLGAYTWVWFDNFAEFVKMAIGDGDVVAISLFNSVRGFLISSVISIPLALLFSYLMFKKVRGYRAISLIFLLPTIVSSFIYTLVFRNFASDGLQEIMHAIGFLNFPNLMNQPEYSFALTCGYGIWCGFGMTLIVFSNAMASIDPNLFESASIDGVRTVFQEFRYLILPLTLPTISTFFVASTAGIFTSAGYVQVFYFANAPEETYNMGYWMWQRVYTNLAGGSSFGIVSAGGLLMSLIILPLTLLVRYWANRVSSVD